MCNLKKTISVMLVLLGVFICPTFAIDVENAAHVWNFDEGKGMLVKDSAADGFDLTIKNAQWFEENGGQVVQFVSDTPKKPSLLSSDNNKITDISKGDFSILSRIKVTEFTNFAPIFTTFGSVNGKYTGFRFCVMKDGKLLFGWANDKGKYDHVVSKHALIVNEWHWVAMVKEGNLVTFYLDGNRAGGRHMKSPDISSLRSTAIVGFEANNAGQLKGMMRHLRFYKQGMGVEDVKRITGLKALPKPQQAKKSNQLSVKFKAFPKPGVILVAADASDFDTLPENISLAISFDKGKEQLTPLALKADQRLDVNVDAKNLPKGDFLISVKLTDSDGKVFGNVVSQMVKWPGRDPAYATFKILNNFVWEIVNVEDSGAAQGPFTFNLPIDRWLWIKAESAEEVKLVVDNTSKSNPPIILKKGASQIIAMRSVEAGEHILRIDGKLDKLVVRTIPTIHLPYLHDAPNPTSFKPFTWEWMEENVNPYGNVITSMWLGPGTPPQVDQWKAQGKIWLSKAPRIFYKKNNEPKDELINRIVDFHTVQYGYSNPLMDGILIDEFYKDKDLYDEYFEAIKRISQDERFKDKRAHAYWAGSPDKSKKFIWFLEEIRKMGGKLYFEAYCSEADTEADAWKDIRYRLEDNYLKVKRLMPDLDKDIIWTFATFSHPTPLAAGYPNANFDVFMDMQFQKLATHPELFGIGGVSFWHSEYHNEPLWRFLGQLIRHYCIEGSDTRFTQDSYILDHVVNPDFTDGLTGWTAKSAENNSISTDTWDGYGKLQGRYYRGNDTFLIMRRSKEGPNIVKQTISNLTPGRMYSLRMYSASLDELKKGESKRALHGIKITINNTEVQKGPQMEFQLPLALSSRNSIFTGSKPLWGNYYWRVFRATETTAELVISDWQNVDKPGAQIGQQMMVNFVEIQPYFEKN